MTQQSKPEQADQQSKGLEMGEQAPTYGSSYSESTPGQIEENRRESLQGQDENTSPESHSDDRSSR